VKKHRPHRSIPHGKGFQSYDLPFFPNFREFRSPGGTGRPLEDSVNMICPGFFVSGVFVMPSVPSVMSDVDLWESVCHDDTRAFAEIVRRHQTAVSAVAFSHCGDLAKSEDLTQEAFLAAWRTKNSLLDSRKLRSWLCGIARNLARNLGRRAQAETSFSADIPEPESKGCDPESASIAQEEVDIVWNALETIPEVYREPLVLFYREQQSIAEVATALSLSQDVIRKRLSRGRELLRRQVADLVETTLQRTRPKGQLTTSIMAGVVAISGSKAAMAGGTAIGTGMTAKGGSALFAAISGKAIGGAMGALGGLLGGILGTWLGTAIPAQLAPTKRERDLYLAAGRRMMVITIVATFALWIVLYLSGGRLSQSQHIGLVLGWIVLLNLYIWMEVYFLIKRAIKIRQETPPASDPNDSHLRRYFSDAQGGSWLARLRGRSFKSATTFWGIPLIDVQLSPPFTITDRKEAKRAFGWIAVGDNAVGLLFGMGGRACGAIALGGMTTGLVAIGGINVGLLSLGGLSIGLVAIGGSAIGWQALAGVAVAWKLALGGMAFSLDTAIGGFARAPHLPLGSPSNFLPTGMGVENAELNSMGLIKLFSWTLTHPWMFGIPVGLFILVLIGSFPLLYYLPKEPSQK
jgi:zinc protease